MLCLSNSLLIVLSEEINKSYYLVCTYNTYISITQSPIVSLAKRSTVKS